MLFLFVSERLLKRSKLVDKSISIKSNPLPMEAEYFAKYEEELREELYMGEKYTRAAKKQIKTLAAIVTSDNATVIGVHVRRTDYVQYRFYNMHIFLLPTSVCTGDSGTVMRWLEGNILNLGWTTSGRCFHSLSS